MSTQQLTIHQETSRAYTKEETRQLAAAIMAKVEDGNIKAAVRILSSEEKPAADTDSPNSPNSKNATQLHQSIAASHRTLAT